LGDWRLKFPDFIRTEVGLTVGRAPHRQTLLIIENELDPHPIQMARGFADHDAG
jgi:hypothetical protein